MDGRSAEKRKKRSLSVSPSAVSAYNLCPRRLAYRRIDKIKAEPSGGKTYGKRLHAELEDYFKTGETKSRLIHVKAAVASDIYPKQSNLLMVESALDWKLDGVPLYGLADLYDPQAHQVFDHKTSKDPAKYGLTEEEMGSDPQAAMYAAYYDARDEPITTTWVYFNTTKKSLPIIATSKVWEPGEAAETMRRIYLPTARKVVTMLQTAETAADVEPNTLACGAFNKDCDYAGLCPDFNLDAALQAKYERDANPARKDTMPTLQELAARQRKATGQTAATPSPAPAEKPKPLPASDARKKPETKGPSLMERAAARRKQLGQPEPTPKAEPTQDLASLAAKRREEQKSAPAVPSAPVDPPEALDDVQTELAISEALDGVHDKKFSTLTQKRQAEANAAIEIRSEEQVKPIVIALRIEILDGKVNVEHLT